MTTDLEARIRNLEDRVELGDLIARYGRYVDDRDYEALGTLYSHDAVFDTVGGPKTGHQAVLDYYRERLALFGPTYHYPHTQEITFTSADQAEGLVCAHAELAIDGEAVWVAIRYDDRYVREDGRWLFRERAVNFLYVMRLSELPHTMGHELRKRWPGTDPEPADLGNH